MTQYQNNPNLEQLGSRLRAARQAKGLSQRELSQRSGFTQAHISRIESGLVDLQLSSLLELARSLELELTLTPRQAKPAIEAIVRSTEAATVSPKVRSDLDRLNEAARTLDRAASASAMPEALRRNLRTTSERLLAALKEFPSIAGALRDAGTVRELSRIAERVTTTQRSVDKLDLGNASELLRQRDPIETALRNARSATEKLSQLRDRVAQREHDAMKPAYALDDDDED